MEVIFYTDHNLLSQNWKVFYLTFIKYENSTKL